MEISGKHTAYRDVETSNDGDIRKAYGLQGCRDRKGWRHPEKIQLTGM